MQDLKKTTELKPIADKYLGVINYNEACALQEKLWQEARDKSQNSIIGLQHPAVLTLGYRANPENEIIEQSSIEVLRSSRGGLATIHSEGQLVIYPILRLKDFGLGVRDYIMLLLQNTQEVLQSYGIQSRLDEKAVGLYTVTGKIAFCGVRIKNGISLHGLSLNIQNDLELFKNIRACGVFYSNMDKVGNYQNISVTQVYADWINSFTNKLN